MLTAFGSVWPPQRAAWPLIAATMLIGCSGSTPPAAPQITAADLASDEAFLEQLDRVLDISLNHRRLNTRDHAAWQIVHGILAFGPQFQIQHQGQVIPALRYLLDGGQLTGWRFEPGDRGLRGILDPGSKTGQGHPDQWLGYLSQCDLSLDETLVVGGRSFTVADLVAHAKWDVRDGMEATWTLMALCTYLPPDAAWTARDGSQWSLERLVAMEAAQLDSATAADGFSAGDGACGGSHRLYALALAVNRYLEATGKSPAELTGGWAAAERKIQAAIARARNFQQADGLFSTNFFDRPGSSAEVQLRINTTGHILEFLTVALTQAQLEEPWVARAAQRLCELLEQTKDIPLECGGLYHAAHGLLLYRYRRFGMDMPEALIADRQGSDDALDAQAKDDAEADAALDAPEPPIDAGEAPNG